MQLTITRFATIAAAAAALTLTACSGTNSQQEAVGSQGQATVHLPIDVGTRCQDDYQNAWQVTWNNYGLCSGFNNRIDDANYLRFYFNLHGAAGALPSPNDTCLGCGGPDSVDLFFMQMHGGFDNDNSWWPMWDQDSWVGSTQLRLGDNGRGASALVNYSCNTMLVDGFVMNRWTNAFDGGLKIGLGAHSLVYNGRDGIGNDFANRVENGESFGNAWANAVYNADHRHGPTILATGADATDCYNRLGITISNLRSTTRLQDWAWLNMCWTTWN